MQLDQLTATLRPRRSWEGLDLGFALARTWFFQLWLLWWVSAVPAALMLLLALGGEPDWWLFLLWWLKPAYEVPLVIWVGRALFGEQIPIRNWGRLLRAAWSPRLLPFLLWRRLSPGRSFNMPIALLEGLRGAAASERRRVLAQGDGSAAWLTIVGYHFEAILWGSILLTLAFMIPEGLPGIDLESLFIDPSSWLHWLSSLTYLVAISIFAPFYVSGGFALYLTRRTDLEAWDLELAFRRAAESRLASSDDRTARSRGTGAGTIAALLLVVGAVWPDQAPLANSLPNPDQAHDLIEEILADEAFGRTREVTLWVPIGGDSSKSEANPQDIDLPDWLDTIGELAAAIGPLVKWALVVLAVVAVVLLARRIIRDWQPSGRLRRGRAKDWNEVPMFTADAPALPGDLAAAVRERLAAGDLRGALALLYRGGIAHLMRLGMEVPDGATEGECLRLAAGHLTPAALSVFRALTRDWQALAYAHRLPSREQVNQRLEQWIDWTGHAAAETARDHDEASQP